jgi:SAM-dependent methyltransferase
MSSDRIRAAYDAIAPRFAATYTGLPAALEALAPTFLASAGPVPLVLDVGCGAGRDMAWLEGRGAEVVGVDLSAGMLAQARSRTGVRGLLVQMDMRNLAFAARSATGVWCVASLLHLPKAEVSSALGEMARVLRPGGALLLSLQEGEGEGWERGLIDGPAEQVERYFARYQPSEIRALLGSAGFVVRRQRSDDAGPRRWLTILAILGRPA